MCLSLPCGSTSSQPHCQHVRQCYVWLSIPGDSTWAEFAVYECRVDVLLHSQLSECLGSLSIVFVKTFK